MLSRVVTRHGFQFFTVRSICLAIMVGNDNIEII